MNKEEKKQVFKIRHSLAHILAASVLKKYPNTKITIGPVIENGFYYDMDFGEIKISDSDLKDFSKNMKKMIGQNMNFSVKEISKEDAMEKFSGNEYKKELIEEISQNGEKITIYKINDTSREVFEDLCEGPHVENTSEINIKAFKLTKIAGAYWRGNEKNKMLTRIYGVAFETTEDLDEYEKNLKEAEKRDHRKIAKELEIFMISEDVGKGLPLWLPNGAFIYKKIQDYMYEKEMSVGFKHVQTPIITKKGLYEKSGHLEHYAEDMYNPMVIENEEYYLRPMNCPHHHQIFNHKPMSYRDLPYKMAEFGNVFRFERSGNLSGIIRTRGFCQNDSHIYLAKSQLKKEIGNVLKMFQEVYDDFAIKDYWFRLALPDAENKEKYGYLDDKEMWEDSAQTAREVMEEMGVKYVEEKGEAAFYGPKIDIQIKNVFGKEDSIATIQLDFYSTKKFDLFFTNKKGEKEPVIIIHRAITGSFERFLAFLLERTSGNLPLWLAPVQAKIIPIGDFANGYAENIFKNLKDDFRVEFDKSKDGFGKKVRKAKNEKLPYFIIIGEKDMEENKLTLENRDTGESEQISLEELREIFEKENK